MLGFLILFMKDRFFEILKSYDICNKGILLAVSGGKDSMTMLDLFNHFKYFFDFKLVVCHFNHSLRDSSDIDENFVKTKSNEYGFKFYSKKEDVRYFSEKNKLSVEEGARILRYRFFDEVKKEENLDYIATAHNKNDLAETVIMRILRGTGIKGLISIQSKRDYLIRPILEFTRYEIEKYVDENIIEFVNDYTNFEDIYNRNKIRLNLLPILQKEYNEKIYDSLCKLSNIAYDYYNISKEYIFSKKNDLWCIKNENIIVDILKLKKESKSFRTILYREFFEFINKNPNGINYKLIEEIDKLIFSKTGKYIEVSNAVFKIDYNKLIICSKNFFENSNGTFYFENLKFSLYSTKFFDIIIEQSNFEEFEILKNKKDIFFINKKYLKYLKIRNRKEGDFLEFKFGKKKLKDLFIDEKISRNFRNNIPIFEIKNSVVWVSNIRRSDKYLIDKSDDIVKIFVLSKERI